jgi:hypothetical protein
VLAQLKKHKHQTLDEFKRVIANIWDNILDYVLRPAWPYVDPCEVEHAPEKDNATVMFSFAACWIHRESYDRI